MAYPKVSIVILNWNGLKDTLECLQSLKKITYPNYDVVIVDNGSRGNDVQALKARFRDSIYIIQNEENLGFATGSNIGMKYALSRGAKYILLLNNDTVVDPQFLTELVKAGESEEDVAAVCPKVYYYDQPQRIQLAFNIIDFRTGRVRHVGSNSLDQGQYDNVRETDEINGCAFLVKSSAVERIGLLNPQYFFYFEETEWSVVARRKGFRLLYVPKSRVWHKISSTAGSNSPFHIYYITKNRILFMKRNATRFQLTVFLLRFFFLQCLINIISFILSKRPYLVLSYVRAIASELKFRL
nr:glycosyltransferase family 2 protein [Candidatus Njordarchaeota archaeon]